MNAAAVLVAQTYTSTYSIYIHMHIYMCTHVLALAWRVSGITLHCCSYACNAMCCHFDFNVMAHVHTCMCVCIF